jgi:hypothetical protein
MENLNESSVNCINCVSCYGCDNCNESNYCFSCFQCENCQNCQFCQYSIGCINSYGLFFADHICDFNIYESNLLKYYSHPDRCEEIIDFIMSGKYQHVLDRLKKYGIEPDRNMLLGALVCDITWVSDRINEGVPIEFFPREMISRINHHLRSKI